MKKALEKALISFLLLVAVTGVGHAAGDHELGSLGGKNDFLCLVEAIYREARSESIEGQQMVAYVMLERASSSNRREFGGPTLCGVFFHRIAGTSVLQFEAANRPISQTVTYSPEWERALEVATSVLKWWLRARKAHALSGVMWYMNPRILQRRDAEKKRRGVKAKDSDCFFRENLFSVGMIGKHEFFRRPRTKAEQRRVDDTVPARCRNIIASR